MAAALRPTWKDSQCSRSVLGGCSAEAGFDPKTCKKVSTFGPCYSITAQRCRQDSECKPDYVLGGYAGGQDFLTCSNTNPDEGSYYCRKNNPLEILVGKSPCQCVVERANVVTWPTVFKNSDAQI